MKRLILLSITLLGITGFISCNTKKTSPEPITSDTLTTKRAGIPADSVLNTSFSANDERFLQFEMIVDQSLSATWKLFSTEDGMKRWAAPVVKVHLAVGGTIQTHYDNTANIGDAGTISLGIINYIPNEMITYKVELNEVFPKACREQDQNLQEIIRLEPVGETQTRIMATMIGWGSGKEWDQTYSFFEKGNQWSYEQLLRKSK